MSYSIRGLGGWRACNRLTGLLRIVTRRFEPAKAWPLIVRESSPPPPPKPRLLDRVREAVRTRHYSRRTEKAYVHWIRRFLFFHDKRHPTEMGPAEISAFLSSLAVRDRVAASTQNQALSARFAGTRLTA